MFRQQLLVLLAAGIIPLSIIGKAAAASQFVTAPAYRAGINPSGVAVADFNRDGRLDVAVANLVGNGVVSLLRANADGSLQPPVSFSTGGLNPAAIAAGDVDGDGTADLVALNSCNNNGCSSGSMAVLVGNGDGTFKSAVNRNVGTTPKSVAIADLNQDGIPDLVVASASSDYLTVFLGTGHGNFSTPVNYGTGTFSLPFFVVVGDFNGDGKPDLATALNGSMRVGVLLGNGDGTFQGPLDLSLGSSAPTALVARDFNGDGKLDLAVASYDPFQSNSIGSVIVLSGRGDGTFQIAGNHVVGSEPVAITAGDYNGDGKLDLAVANYQSANVSVLVGDGSGAFTAVAAWSAGAYPVGLANRTFHGKTDLVLANSLSNNVSVLHAESRAFTAAHTYFAGSDPTAAVVADFNHDGRLDVAVANAYTNNVTVFPGGANGNLRAGTNYDVGEFPHSLAMGDFNGDGNLDLVTANVQSANVAVLLGNGQGGFGAAQTFSTAQFPEAVAVGDFNGEGKLDLAVADKNGLAILLGNGNGTFQAAVRYGAGSSPIFVAGGDFNHDTRLDVAVVNSGSNNVSIFLGKGDGTFSPAVNYAVGSVPLSLAVADLNHDDNPDLAAANLSGNNVSVLLGSGDGTFQTAVNYGVGAQTLSLSVADFDGNGNPDLAVAALKTGIAIFSGKGDGTFQSPVIYAAGSPNAVAVGDLNDDQAPDLVVPTGGGGGYVGDVAILLSTAHQ